jgi:hypothetical protein
VDGVRGRRVAERVLLALLVATVGAAGYPVLASEQRSGATPRHPARTAVRSFPLGGCLQSRDGHQFGGTCAPPAPDLGIRLILTHDEQLQLFHAAPAVVDAVDTARTGCTPSDHGGSPVQGGSECSAAGRTATPAGVRLALTEAGFRTAEVRLAGLDDPAPVGSVLYGVHLGDGCLIGYSGTDSSSWIEGPLLDGTCLGRSGL